MTNKLNRVPLQVSPKFMERLKDIQKRIRMQTGENKSLRDLTDEIIKSSTFSDIEKNLLNATKIDINIKFDRRLLR